MTTAQPGQEQRMDDLVERLRVCANSLGGGEECDVMEQAADRIELYREALAPFAIEPDSEGFYDVTELGGEQFDKARAVLSRSGG